MAFYKDRMEFTMFSRPRSGREKKGNTNLAPFRSPILAEEQGGVDRLPSHDRLYSLIG